MGKLELIHKIQLRLAVWKGKILNSRKKNTKYVKLCIICSYSLLFVYIYIIFKWVQKNLIRLEKGFLELVLIEPVGGNTL